MQVSRRLNSPVVLLIFLFLLCLFSFAKIPSTFAADLNFNNNNLSKTPYSNSVYLTYSYDARNRVTQQTVHAGQNTYNTSYVYDGWNVTVTDPNSQEKKFYKDAYGQLIRVDEYLGANTYSTYYEYNLEGQSRRLRPLVRKEKS